MPTSNDDRDAERNAPDRSDESDESDDTATDETATDRRPADEDADPDRADHTSGPTLDPDAYETVDIDPTIDVSYDDHPICVPVAIFERESIPQELIELLSPVPVVVLGYYVLPDQTAPGQARMQFEARAQRELDDLASAFEASGGAAETRLAFTRDADQTIERVVLDDRCSAVLLVNPAPTIDRVLVALRDDRNVEQVARVAATLLAAIDADVTVYHVAATEADRDRGAELVAGAADLIEAEGLSRDRITEEVVVSDTPVKSLVTRADEDFDLVIIGETEPTLRERIVGETPQRIAERSLEPVLVVRRIDGPDAVEDSDDST